MSVDRVALFIAYAIMVVGGAALTWHIDDRIETVRETVCGTAASLFVTVIAGIGEGDVSDFDAEALTTAYDLVGQSCGIDLPPIEVPPMSLAPTTTD